MNEWDFENDSGASGNSAGNAGRVAGKLNVPMAIACFLSVAAVSFAVAWFMKDRVRSFWEMGLTFAAPVAALMGSALLVEHATSRMTPQVSRNAQTVSVLITVAAAFLFPPQQIEAGVSREAVQPC